MKLITVLLLSFLMLTACATPQQERAAARGGAVGAVAGAVIGAPNDRMVEGAVIGGVIGAAAGAILVQPKQSPPVQRHRYERHAQKDMYEHEEDEHRHHDD
jgi:uncharacterized membrane protein